MKNESERKKRLKEVQAQMRRLMEEMVNLSLAGDEEDEQTSYPKGTRILITRKDKYRGRTGTVIDKQSTSEFWNLRLDARGRNEPQCVVRKMDTGFCIIETAPEHHK